MLHQATPIFARLLDRIARMPVVDCHEHILPIGDDLGQRYTEPIQALTVQYVGSDLWSAGARDGDIAFLQDPAISTDAKWNLFERLWSATRHTAYARVTQLVLREQYGIRELTRASLDRVADKIAQHDAGQSLRLLEQANVQAIISDALFPPPGERFLRHFANPVLKTFLGGQLRAPAVWHPVFNLVYFHGIRQREFLDYVGSLTDHPVTSLADYEQAVFQLIRRCRELGVVALKDQSAYWRTIAFDLPPREEAERLFNRLLVNPRNPLGWEEAKPLSDYLFHQFMRFARELTLPVQVHTGHVAGIRNRIDKANPSLFASVLEVHTQVDFDLFHGGWPYMGDILFIAKNYPNGKLDLCWLPIIDPLYAQELIKRAVMTVPHVKIHGFGGDYWNAPEYSVAHLAIAREVIAAALADLIEMGWLEEEQALQLAAGWLYNNPNRFFKLGLPEFKLSEDLANIE